MALRKVPSSMCRERAPGDPGGEASAPGAPRRKQGLCCAELGPLGGLAAPLPAPSGAHSPEPLPGRVGSAPAFGERGTSEDSCRGGNKSVPRATAPAPGPRPPNPARPHRLAPLLFPRAGGPAPFLVSAPCPLCTGLAGQRPLAVQADTSSFLGSERPVYLRFSAVDRLPTTLLHLSSRVLRSPAAGDTSLDFRGTLRCSCDAATLNLPGPCARFRPSPAHFPHH